MGLLRNPENYGLNMPKLDVNFETVQLPHFTRKEIGAQGKDVTCTGSQCGQVTELRKLGSCIFPTTLSQTSSYPYGSTQVGKSLHGPSSPTLGLDPQPQLISSPL